MQRALVKSSMGPTLKLDISTYQQMGAKIEWDLDLVNLYITTLI
jgi:hypothetical protein